jgi:peptidoglycan/LPS O-acetylase OafA/YrhL
MLHVVEKSSMYFGWPSFCYSVENGGEKSSMMYVKNMMYNLSLGVDIFFIISGFLITYLLLAEKNKTGTVNLTQFYVRRVLRIWPLYFLILFTGPLLTYFMGEKSPDYFMYFIFAGNFSLIKEGWISPSVSHLWSICIEEHFYLVWPILAKYANPKNFLNIMVVALIGVFFFKIHTHFSTSDRWMTLYLHTLSRCDILILGSIVGWIYFYNPFIVNFSTTIRVVVYTFFIVLLFLDNTSQNDLLFDATLKRVIYSFGGIFWFLNVAFNPKAWFVNLHKGINYLGKASYSLYMWHPVILAVTTYYLNYYKIYNFWISIFLSLIFSIIISLLSYAYFEQPFLIIKEKLFSRYKKS